MLDIPGISEATGKLIETGVLGALVVLMVGSIAYVVRWVGLQLFDSRSDKITGKPVGIFRRMADDLSEHVCSLDGAVERLTKSIETVSGLAVDKAKDLDELKRVQGAIRETLTSHDATMRQMFALLCQRLSDVLSKLHDDEMRRDTLLVIEDVPAEARLVRESLEPVAAESRMRLMVVSTLSEAVQHIGRAKVVVLDVRLPDSTPVAVNVFVLLCKSSHCTTIVVSGVEVPDGIVASHTLAKGTIEDGYYTRLAELVRQAVAT